MLIVQISDLHVFTDHTDLRARNYLKIAVDRGFINGADVWGSLGAVLDAVEARHGDFDLLMVTGDVAQDEQLETYHRFRGLLVRCPSPCPAYPAPPQPQAPTPPVDRLTPGAGQEERGWLERSRLIPGNHESRSLMTQAFPELFATPSPASCFSLPGPNGWRLIGIDTHDTDASEGWNGDTDDEAFKAHGWDGQGGVVKPTQYGTLSWLAVGCVLRVVSAQRGLCMRVAQAGWRGSWRRTPMREPSSSCTTHR